MREPAHRRIANLLTARGAAPTVVGMRRLLAVAFFFLLTAPALRADDWSVRAGAYLDAEAAFIGGEYRFPLTHELRLAPNLELAFPDNATSLAMSLDLHYDFHTKGRVQPWVGGGLGIYFLNPEGPGEGDTDVGANFIGGLGLKSRFKPHLQIKVVVKGDTETVLAFGLRF